MKKTEKKSGEILFHIAPIILTFAMLLFGGLYMKEYLQYKSAEDEYTKLSKSFIQNSGFEDMNSGPEHTVKDDSKKEEEDNMEETPIYDPSYYPAFQINYDALLETNPDFACVIYIPALNILYPVAYSADNMDYLYKTFEGNKNSSGSIFYDALSQRDFLGQNTFLFGHNMKNGAMFGTLKRFDREKGLCASNPFVYIYTKECVRKYRIFSYYQTVEESPSYDDFDGADGYDRYVRMICEHSSPVNGENGIDFTARPQLLTLSTCSGTTGSSKRYVVHAAQISKICLQFTK